MFKHLCLIIKYLKTVCVCVCLCVSVCICVCAGSGSENGVSCPAFSCLTLLI